MFTKFARRLTGWYVAAAVTLVVVVLGGFALAGIYVYEHVIQDGIDADAREAQAFGLRAAQRHESFIPGCSGGGEPPQPARDSYPRRRASAA